MATGEMMRTIAIALMLTFAGAAAPPPARTTTMFYDAEVPVGEVNGVNASFNLSAAPNPQKSLELVRNGIVQKMGLDYTIRGATILFGTKSIPQTEDILQAWYRTSGALNADVVFNDAEVPTGSLDGKNAVFTLSVAPNPAESLRLVRNGIIQRVREDYVLEQGTRVVFKKASIPQKGDILQTWYRSKSAPTW